MARFLAVAASCAPRGTAWHIQELSLEFQPQLPVDLWGACETCERSLDGYWPVAQTTLHSRATSDNIGLAMLTMSLGLKFSGNFFCTYFLATLTNASFIGGVPWACVCRFDL